MEYTTLDHCIDRVFPFIHAHLSEHEPAPEYEFINSGMGQLEKVLQLVQSDVYYPTFSDKCAYLLCSIAGSQYFPNGNKRLGVAVLIDFLIINSAEIVVLNSGDYRELLNIYYPSYTWEENENIRDPHPLFLYNLAIVIGTPSIWEFGHGFDQVKESVSEVFEQLYRLKEPY
ncbi:MAG: hypothetical protein WD135_08195 [Ferruginibacter sp.]